MPTQVKRTNRTLVDRLLCELRVSATRGLPKWRRLVGDEHHVVAIRRPAEASAAGPCGRRVVCNRRERNSLRRAPAGQHCKCSQCNRESNDRGDKHKHARTVCEKGTHERHQCISVARKPAKHQVTATKRVSVPIALRAMQTPAPTTPVRAPARPKQNRRAEAKENLPPESRPVPRDVSQTPARTSAQTEARPGKRETRPGEPPSCRPPAPSFQAPPQRMPTPTSPTLLKSTPPSASGKNDHSRTTSRFLSSYKYSG